MKASGVAQQGAAENRLFSEQRCASCRGEITSVPKIYEIVCGHLLHPFCAQVIFTTHLRLECPENKCKAKIEWIRIIPKDLSVESAMEIQEIEDRDKTLRIRDIKQIPIKSNL